MHKSWFSLLIALLKDRNLGHLAAHTVMRQPGMSVVNDLEVHVLPLLLSCTLTKHQTYTGVHPVCKTVYCDRAKSLHAMLRVSWGHTMYSRKAQAVDIGCLQAHQGSQVGTR